MTDPAVDLVREACALLAGFLPVLAALTPEPDIAQVAAPGMTARPPSAPVPGNAAAFYALTGIGASARQLEGVLKYAAGARRPGPLSPRGGSDANTLLALDAIPALAEIADDDFYRLIVAELEARLEDARRLRAVDEAQQWRYVRGRACPYCHCFAALRVLLDAKGNPTGHVECHAGPVTRGGVTVWCADANGYRPAAQMGTDERGVPGLRWADGSWEPAPDIDLEG